MRLIYFIQLIIGIIFYNNNDTAPADMREGEFNDF